MKFSMIFIVLSLSGVCLASQQGGTNPTQDNKKILALKKAFKHSKYETVKKIIRQGVEVNAPITKNGLTALMIAARDSVGGDLVGFLLDQPNIDVNRVNNVGRNALHYAVVAGNRVAEMRLLKINPLLTQVRDNNGATPYDYLNKNIEDKFDMPGVASPQEQRESEIKINDAAQSVKAKAYFMKAAYEHDAKKLAEYLAEKVNVNTINELGITALMLQAQSPSEAAQEALVFLLHQPDINLDAEDKKGKTALHHAAEHNNAVAIQQLLAHHANPEIEDQHKETPFVVAVKNNTQEAIIAFLKGGTDINYELSFAAVLKNIPLMKKLIALGADINTKEVQEGYTPLMLLVQEGATFEQLSEFLKLPNIAFDAKDFGGNTALVWAVYKENPVAAELLIAHKVDVNAKNDSGYTPLMVAARGKDGYQVRMLLQAGADATIANAKDENRTAQDYAKNIGWQKEYDEIMAQVTKEESENKAAEGSGSEDAISPRLAT